jgi:prepilin-type N-terminal cleavage/methylation domain-containing protein
MPKRINAFQGRMGKERDASGEAEQISQHLFGGKVMNTTTRRAFQSKAEGGFTLIEIIAVLVILGMLAAVAVPKYLNMQQQAALNAAQGALGAGASNATMQYSQQLLQGVGAAGAVAAAVVELNKAPYTTVGDFMVSYAANGATGIDVALQGPAPGSANGTAVVNNLNGGVAAVPVKTITFQ